MAIFGIGAILLLLFLLGCALAVIVAVGVAVFHGRFALAAVIGGGSFLSVIVAAVLVALFVATVTQRQASVVESDPPIFKTANESSPAAQFQWTSPHQVVVSSHPESSPRWRIGVVPAIVLILTIAFLLARSAKHHFAHAAAGHNRAWPAFLAVPLIAILIFGGLRVQSENRRSAAEETSRAAAEQTAEINEKFRAKAEALTKQQQDLAKRVAELSKSIQRRIDNSDIHQLMDEFDAPRIALQAPITIRSPTAFLVAAAPSAFDSFQKSRMAEAEAETTATQSTKHEQIEHSHTKTIKKNTTKSVASASTSKDGQPPVVPEMPTPPSPPAPTATPALAAISASAPQPLVAESPSDDTFDLNRPEVTSPSAAWHIPPHAAKKPAWINDPLKKTGDVRREVIATEEYATANDCYRAADICLMLKAFDRLQEKEGGPQPFSGDSDSELPAISFRGKSILFSGNEVWNGTWTDGRLRLLSSMRIDPDFLRREIVAKDSKNNESCEYIDTVERSVGPMKKLYIQIEFTPAVDRELMQRSDAFHRTSRFKGIGLGAFSIFGLLSIAWGMLKLDTATKGYYTKWLFVGVPIAIIGVTMLSLLALVGFRG